MAAVSIQLMPSSSARWMAAIESLSSCAPQPNSQSPPMAHAPKPMGVMFKSELPRALVFMRVNITKDKNYSNSVSCTILLSFRHGKEPDRGVQRRRFCHHHHHHGVGLESS